MFPLWVHFWVQYSLLLQCEILEKLVTEIFHFGFRILFFQVMWTTILCWNFRSQCFRRPQLPSSSCKLAAANIWIFWILVEFPSKVIGIKMLKVCPIIKWSGMSSLMLHQDSALLLVPSQCKNNISIWRAEIIR